VPKKVKEAGEFVHPMNEMAKFFRLVLSEMDRQRTVHGDDPLHDGTGDESWQEAEAEARKRCHKRFKKGKGTWLDIALEEFMEVLASEPDSVHLEKEIVQAAAVLGSWWRDIQRRDL
jgi:hypothetical protein